MRGEHRVRFVPLDALSRLSFSALRDRFIHGRIFQAASLMMGAQVLSQVIRLGGNLIITRLLAPEMFGLMILVIMIQVTLGLLSDIGLRSAIIQSKRGDDPVLLNTAFSVQVLRGVIMWIACVAIAMLLYLANSFGLFKEGTAFTAPELPLLLIAASFVFVIGGFQSTNHMTAGRNLALGRLIIIDGAAQIGSLILMIALGYFTRSIWSLVAASVVATLITTVMSHTYLPGIKNRFMWNREALTEISKFGQWVLVSSITFVFATNIDRAFLGAVVSAATLGIYSIALNLHGAVDGLISRLFDNVVLPALSEASRESHEKLRQQLMRLRPPIDIWYLSSAGFLFAVAPSLVSLLYDHRYEDAGALLQILSFSLVFARYGVFSMAYLAVGRPKYQAILSFVRLVAVAVLLPTLFYMYGLHGAMYAIALHPIVMMPFHYVFARELGLADLKYELMVLPAWPAGYIAGLTAIAILTRILG
jgi:O-antigen/teichoic acid export membrane protein